MNLVYASAETSKLICLSYRALPTIVTDVALSADGTGG